jgi:hypothetical protein
MLLIVLPDQLLKIPDILNTPYSLSPLHFVTLCENKSHWYLKHIGMAENSEQTLI